MAKNTVFRTNVLPDRVDFRDRPYRPAISFAPPPKLGFARREGPHVGLEPKLVLNQGESAACTGFALAATIDRLLIRAARPEAKQRTSPHMLYSMAQRYDEFPGQQSDTGSSLRGVLKGWFKHGACRSDLWIDRRMPPPNAKPKKDWWQDSVLRPLGAYYRVDGRALADMRVALNETGAMLASARVHDGWFTTKAAKGRPPLIPFASDLGHEERGHAFVIMGYDKSGFLIQNSWGTAWGCQGYAVLEYQDWLLNGLDCWIAQLGVVTNLHERLSDAATLRVEDGRVLIASDVNLRNREVSPFVVNVDHKGRLSTAGVFRTYPDDLKALFRIHFERAAELWSRTEPGRPIDVAVYANSGMVSDDEGAESAARWVRDLYQAEIFPVYLMWETDFLARVRTLLRDALGGHASADQAAPGLGQWWNERIERLIAAQAEPLWDHLKEAAQNMARGAEDGEVVGAPNATRGRGPSGVLDLYSTGKELGYFPVGKIPVRLHLVGHSAGCLALTWVLDELLRQNDDLEIASVTFLAPAMSVDMFTERPLPHLLPGTNGRPRIRRYTQVHLSDDFEKRDAWCPPYDRSILHLISQSFETRPDFPLLGLERHWNQLALRAEVKELVSTGTIRAVSCPSALLPATTHEALDVTHGAARNAVVSGLKQSRLRPTRED